MNATEVWLYWAAGLTVVTGYLLVPFLAAWVGRAAGTVWSPVNDYYKYSSDDNIYAAMVQSARRNFPRFDYPAREDAEMRDFEVLRAGTYRLACLLGFFLSDPRWLHLISYVNGVALNYTFVFLAAGLFLESARAAMLAGVAYLIYFALFQKPFRTRTLKWFLVECVFNRHRRAYFDVINDNYRYAILSIAGVGCTAALWFHGQLLQGDLSAVGIAGLAGLLACSAFLYPGVLVAVAGSTVCVAGLASVMEGSAGKLGSVALAGAAALVILAVGGRLRKVLRALLNPPRRLVQMHAQHRDRAGLFAAVASLPQSRYVRSLVLAMVLGWPSLPVRQLCVALFLMCAGAHVLARWRGYGEELSRLSERGLSHLYAFALLVAAGTALQAGGARLGAGDPWLDTPGWTVLLLGAVAGPPLLGAWRMFRAHMTNQTYALPADQWKIYAILQREAREGDMAAALDVADLQLLPVYTPCRLVVAGAEWLEDPLDVVRRYLALLRACDISPALLTDWLRHYPEAACRYEPSPRTPKAPREVLEPYVTLNRLLYPAHTRSFEGMLMREPDGRWTDAFLARMEALVQDAQTQAAGLPDDCRWLILPAHFEARRRVPMRPPEGFTLRHAGREHFLYMRKAIGSTSANFLNDGATD